LPLWLVIKLHGNISLKPTKCNSEKILSSQLCFSFYLGLVTEIWETKFWKLRFSPWAKTLISNKNTFSRISSFTIDQLQLQDEYGHLSETIFLTFVDLRVFKFCTFYISRWMLVIFLSLPLYHNLVVTTIIKQIKSENFILSYRLVLKLWSPLNASFVIFWNFPFQSFMSLQKNSHPCAIYSILRAILDD